MFRRLLEPDVAIKFPICGIARVTLSCAPDAPARIAIPGECGRPRQGVTGRVNRATRARLAEHQAVGIRDEPPDVRFAQDILNSRIIGAFGQPETSRFCLESLAEGLATDPDLGANRFRCFLKQWKQAVGCPGCGELEDADLLETAKNTDEVAVPVEESVANL